VLAVGDAAFAQKCMDVFHQKRRAGKTLVLVTHDMATVQGFCDNAMLLHDGQPQYIGDPEETALRYYRMNFGGGNAPGEPAHSVPDVNVSLLDVWLEDEEGGRVENVEQGAPIRLNLVVEARHELTNPVFNFHFVNSDGVWVFGFSKAVPAGNDEPARLAPGERVRIAGRIDNPLVPGRYSVDCWIARDRDAGDLALHVLRLTDFFVYGTRPGPGSVSVQADIEAVLEPEARR
jgi:ABC-2 type transport system ATP-binding protein